MNSTLNSLFWDDFIQNTWVDEMTYVFTSLLNDMVDELTVDQLTHYH